MPLTGNNVEVFSYVTTLLGGLFLVEVC